MTNCRYWRLSVHHLADTAVCVYWHFCVVWSIPTKIGRNLWRSIQGQGHRWQYLNVRATQRKTMTKTCVVCSNTLTRKEYGSVPRNTHSEHWSTLLRTRHQWLRSEGWPEQNWSYRKLTASWKQGKTWNPARYGQLPAPHLAGITAPLRSRLSQQSEFVWDAPQQHAFEEIKTIITNSPVLGFYDPNVPLILESDA